MAKLDMEKFDKVHYTVSDGKLFEHQSGFAVDVSWMTVGEFVDYYRYLGEIGGLVEDNRD